MAHLRALRSLAPLLAVLLLIAGCGSSGKKADGTSPTEVMATAKKKFDESSSIHIDLSTDSMPTKGNGVLGASGDVTHDPAFEGDVKVLLTGFTATVPVTSVGGKVYAKLPLQTKYSVINAAEYGAPDPADFADPDKGLSALLTKLDGLKKGRERREGERILTSYSGTLPGAAVKVVIPSAEAKETYPTVVGIDDKGYAVTVRITGTFFSGVDDTTYDVTFSDYGKGVKITAPAL